MGTRRRSRRRGKIRDKGRLLRAWRWMRRPTHKLVKGLGWRAPERPRAGQDVEDIALRARHGLRCRPGRGRARRATSTATEARDGPRAHLHVLRTLRAPNERSRAQAPIVCFRPPLRDAPVVGDRRWIELDRLVLPASVRSPATRSDVVARRSSSGSDVMALEDPSSCLWMLPCRRRRRWIPPCPPAPGASGIGVQLLSWIQGHQRDRASLPRGTGMRRSCPALAAALPPRMHRQRCVVRHELWVPAEWPRRGNMGASTQEMSDGTELDHSFTTTSHRRNFAAITELERVCGPGRRQGSSHGSDAVRPRSA